MRNSGAPELPLLLSSKGLAGDSRGESCGPQGLLGACCEHSLRIPRFNSGTEIADFSQGG